MDISVHRTVLIDEDRSWLASAHGIEACRTVTLDLSTFTEGTHFPDGLLRSGTALGRITGTRRYGPYAANSSEVQTVTIDATGGTFTLTFDGETTAAIAENAAAAAVQAALEALSNVNVGDVAVTGSAGGPYTVTFGGQYLGDNVPAMTADAGSLTGGAGTGVVATGTAGGSAVTDGRAEFAGHLFNTIDLQAKVLPDYVGAPLLEHGVVLETLLPTNHGLDAAAKASPAGGRFVYRDR